MTTVGELKKLIADLPDHALVVTNTKYSVIEAEAKVGSAQEPNEMGFTTFTEDDHLEHPAVYVYAPFT
jgi:hypothetical protein